MFRSRAFILCGDCKLIFVPEQYRLAAEEERRRYMLHRNNIESEGYVAFLRQAIDPALRYINCGMKGLDFGCGPAPMLATLLGRMKILCRYYAPFFFPEIDDTAYDFIFSTECIEHFYHPRKTFERIDTLLRKGGFLILMTSFWNNLQEFPAWYYKNDPAHVAFYHPDTLGFLAKLFRYEFLYNDGKRVAIFKKS